MASYSMHAVPTVPLTYLSLFGVGAFLMRSAGCTINDMWDKNLDKAVERTKTRPLAQGSIKSRQALGFLSLQLTAALCVLLQLNWYSIALGASSLSVVTVYPLMKRITYWPQFVLGLAFNWGALLGWSAVAGAVNWTVCLPLYAGSIFWTLVYDTVYAHQDKVDDVNVGIRSTALLFGEKTRTILSTFSVSSLSLISYAGYLNGQGLPFYAGIGLAGIQLARVLKETRWNDRGSCWQGFVRCGWVGIWVWAGTTLDYAVLASGLLQ
ncbi:Para-hydroxybenzoate--polyprenyltransferase, mitochondrial precursor (PHB:polyprenyltransferase) [Tulasnella sp. JGI-2019a]|nr:Para-hydroxybenzoate--polyprenyltransferase, mitochondrial precursor (PHB:polyprenyltransferase) [Tulasnella sp. JGI-2019a]KAG8996834.1 Para-hydroxybenzoate--polyprenyltransferase, mitochondrial precursor (PHB:polyprenyltransferase) [Tulasnella sp. JGI-2019a]KAG9034996.1 Para-hydroxybenzoate--polyprenyltransferase, mitochondrial precursor (PHB:polyprenyltransferase) [Tulasnella sp. JGI-2019a]